MASPVQPPSPMTPPSHDLVRERVPLPQVELQSDQLSQSEKNSHTFKPNNTI